MQRRQPAPSSSPSPVTGLEARFTRHRNAGYLAVALLVVVDLLLAVRIWLHANAAIDTEVVLLFGASAAVHLLPLRSLFRRAQRRVRNLKHLERVGRYSSSEIKRMLADALRPYHGREVPAVYITEQKGDGASAINSLFFNFVKPLNAVYISRHLFQILHASEIKAVLAHELAHFHRYIQPLSRAGLALTLFHALVPAQIVAAQNGGGLGTAFAIWLIMLPVLARVLTWCCGRDAHVLEFLCDYQAARQWGILPLVNGLLGIGRTTEILFVLQGTLLRRIREDDTLSIQHLPALLEMIDAAIPDGPVTPRDLDAAVARVLDSDPARHIRKQLTKQQVGEETRQINAILDRFLMEKVFAVVDWRRFDCVNPNGRVDVEEYPRLIEILETEPHQQLLAVPTEDRVHAANGTHPTTRDRILFLEACRRAGLLRL